MAINISLSSAVSTAVLKQTQPGEKIKSTDTAAINNLFGLGAKLMLGETTPQDAYYTLKMDTREIHDHLSPKLRSELDKILRDLINGEKPNPHEFSAFIKEIAKEAPPSVLTIQGAQDLADHFSNHSSPVTTEERAQIQNFLKKEIYPNYHNLDSKAQNLVYQLYGDITATAEQIKGNLDKLIAHLKHPDTKGTITQIARNGLVAARLAKGII